MAATIRALGYARRSKEDDRENAPGVAQQERAIREYCAKKGYKLVDFYADSDRSGYIRHVVRPGFDELRANLGRGDVVVTWAQDRLTRDVAVWASLVSEARAAGIERFEQVSGGDVDLSAPGDLFQGDIMASVSNFYSRQLSENSRRGHRARAERGEQNGGHRTFGFRAIATPDGKYATKRSNEHDPEEVALIWEAANRVLDGESIRGIAVDWNERGIESVTGKPWTHTVLRTILTNPKLIAKRAVGHWQTLDRVSPETGVPVKRYVIDRYVDASWEPILDVETFERVQARIAANGRNPKRGRELQRWLSNVAVCGKCGEALRAKIADGKPVYFCRPSTSGGCGGLRIPALPLEAHALDLMEKATADRDRLARAIGGDEHVEQRRALEAEIGSLEERREKLADDYADGRVDARFVEIAMTKIAAKLEDASDRLASLAPVEIDIDLDAVDDLAEANPYELRKLARLVFESFVVLPAWRRGRLAKDDDPLRGRLDIATAF